MDLEAYKSIISKLADSNTVADAIVELSDRLNADITDYNKIKSDLASVRDINSKLALRVTGATTSTNNETNEDVYEAIEQKMREGFING